MGDGHPQKRPPIGDSPRAAARPSTETDAAHTDAAAQGVPDPTPHALPTPTAQELLTEILTLGREAHLELDEAALVDRFLTTLARLFPARAFAVRCLDPRAPTAARCYTAGHALRDGVDTERITIKRSSIGKTRLKRAVAASARLRFGPRWDSPFPGLAAGFAVPLVASGELYGVLDIGYPLGADRVGVDEPLILPLANHLSVALRNERLYRETTVLRDYQAKLIEHANALILGVDQLWRIRVCNQALCRLTGYDKDDLIGRDLRDWLPVEDRERLTHMFMKALSGDNADAVDVTLLTRSGRVRTLWSIAAISGHGQVEAVVAIGQDQTKLRELQRQVIQAEKLATLGQLAAGVVHELGNPLTSITVYADYLASKAERGPIGADDADIEKLRRIRASAQRIAAFAKDLVQYAKPAGDEPEALSLSAVVNQSLSFCEHLFDRCQIALRSELAQELPLVHAVPGQIEQVVINLVTNAAHAIDGPGAVTVRTFAADPGHVELVVADTGPGIPEADRARVFEPFYTTKTGGEGTGLGLSIVANIIEQHNGQIWIEDAPGGGAAFHVRLPTRP